MKYFNQHDGLYTAAGIISVVGYIVMFTVLSSFGWFGWFLNLLMIVGLGAVLGDAIQNWHIDWKFKDELDGFEENLREVLNLRKNGPTGPSQ